MSWTSGQTSPSAQEQMDNLLVCIFPTTFPLAQTGEQWWTDGCIRVGSAVHLTPLHEDQQKKPHSESSSKIKCGYNLIFLISHLYFQPNAGANVLDLKCFTFNRGAHLALTPLVSQYKFLSSFTPKGPS